MCFYKEGAEMGKRVKRASGYFKKGPQRPKTDTGDQS